MKKLVIGAAIVAALAGGTAVAVVQQPADKLSHEELLQLQIDAMQLDRIQQAANAAAAGPIADREAILKKHNLDWQKMGGEGAEQYVDKDGGIHRKTQSQSDMGAKPAKEKK